MVDFRELEVLRNIIETIKGQELCSGWPGPHADEDVLLHLDTIEALVEAEYWRQVAARTWYDTQETFLALKTGNQKENK